MLKLARKYVLISTILTITLLIGSLTSLTVIDLLNLPHNLHLVPGESMILSVHFPLCFSVPTPAVSNSNPAKLINDRRFTEKIRLSSQNRQHFNIQLLVFGKIQLRKVQVEIAPPPIVIPGGQAIGVLFSSEGVMIVGHLPIKGIDHRRHYPAKTAGLKAGDILMAIDGRKVNRVDEVEYILKQSTLKQSLNLTVKRQDKIEKFLIHPVLCSEPEGRRYMLGIFIEDPAAGIGTLIFYDPVSHYFAGLGHRIAEFAGNKEIPLQSGEIVQAQINGIKSGSPGQPGEKIGVFTRKNHIIGQIKKNNSFGIYGSLNTNFLDQNICQIPIAYSSEIQTGPATISTVIHDNLVEKFQVEIIKVFRQDLPSDKGLILKVTDPRLLKETGGIIQGMSGSPIIQNGKLIGVVTHVFVNDPTKGYGVLAEWMFNEMKQTFSKKYQAS